MTKNNNEAALCFQLRAGRMKASRVLHITSTIIKKLHGTRLVMQLNIIVMNIMASFGS